MENCPVCGSGLKQKEIFWIGRETLNDYTVSFLCGSRFKIVDEKVAETLVKCKGLNVE